MFKVLLLGILVIFSFERIFLHSKSMFDSCVSYVAYPCMCVAHAVSERISTMVDQGRSYKELVENYEKLREEHQKTVDELVQMRACTYYFHAIQELIEFRLRYNQTGALIAQVIGKNISEHEHVIFVDRGLADGVSTDMIAMFKTHIIGRVSEVFGWYSKIMLITDQHSKIAVYASKTEATGIVQGCNDIKKVSFNYVSHLSPIEDDDMVLSSGQGLVFPQGFCVGKITHHELPEKALYHSIDVEPLIDLAVLNCCTLIKVENVNPS